MSIDRRPENAGMTEAKRAQLARWELIGRQVREQREEGPENYAQQVPIPEPERRKPERKEVAPEVLAEIRRLGRGPSPRSAPAAATPPRPDHAVAADRPAPASVKPADVAPEVLDA